MLRVVLVVVCLSALPRFAEGGLMILVEPDLSAYLYNPEPKPLAFDGYHLQSATGQLRPSAWMSISDYSLAFQSDQVIASLGLGALTFGETKPSSTSLAELNLGSFGILQPGDRFPIGRPFSGNFSALVASVGTQPGSPDNPEYAVLSYHMPGAVPSLPGDIMAVPEPSTWLLLGLAGLGWGAMVRRRA